MQTVPEEGDACQHDRNPYRTGNDGSRTKPACNPAFKPLLDTMLEHQAKQIEEHECWQCGFEKPYAQMETRILRGYDGPEVILVCIRCLSLGWDEWHRA